MGKHDRDNRNHRAPLPVNTSVEAARQDIEGKPDLGAQFGIKARPYVPTPEDSVSKIERESAKIPDHIPRTLPIDPSELHAQREVAAERRQGRQLPAFLQPADSPLPELSQEQMRFISGMRELEETEGDEIDRNFNALKGRSGGVDMTQVEEELDQRHRNVAPHPQASSQEPRETPNAQILPERPLRHPVLDRMLASFGLERLPIRYEKIAGFSFGFRKPNLEDEALAVRLAGLRSHSDLEFTMYKSILLMSISVVSIDDVPVHEIFDVKLPQREKDAIIRNPANPPATSVAATAPRVILFMIDNIEPNVLDDLSKAFADMYREEEDANQGDHARYLRETYRFECNIDGCNEVQNRVPNIIDATQGTYEAIYCPIHGKPMRAVSSLEEHRNNPLA